MTILIPAACGIGDLDELLRRPVSFSDYMRVFEDNYTHLERLLARADEPACFGNGRARIHFAPLGKNEYTTTVRMAYTVLRRDGAVAVEPLSAVVNIYHDTWQAELVRPYGALSKRLEPYLAFGMYVRKWLLNAFLRQVLRAVGARPEVRRKMLTA